MEIERKMVEDEQNLKFGSSNLLKVSETFGVDIALE